MKRLILFTFIIIFLILHYPTQCIAEHSYMIGINIYTDHVNRDSTSSVQENNKGIMIGVDNFMIGMFETSKYNDGYFLTYTLKTEKITFKDYYGRLNAHIGTVYGYNDEINIPDIKGWIPIIIPTVEMGWKNIGLQIVPFYRPWDNKGLIIIVLTYSF